MSESLLTDPLLQDRGLRWLIRGRPARIGTACRLPDCVRVVDMEQGPGARGWFCSRGHREEYRARHDALVRAITRLEARLSGGRGLTYRETRAAEADLTYLRKVAVAYLDVRTQVSSELLTSASPRVAGSRRLPLQSLSEGGVFGDPPVGRRIREGLPMDPRHLAAIRTEPVGQFRAITVHDAEARQRDGDPSSP